MRENWDTRTFHGNDPRRALSTLGILVRKIGVVGADSHTNHERSKNVEEEDTPKHASDSLGNVLARVGSLTSSDGDHLHASIREGSIDERAPKTSETTSVPFTHPFLHRAFLPVSKSKAVMARASTKKDDKADD